MRRYEINRIRLKNQLRLEKLETDTLRNMDKIKSQFFANISHELRTPLTLILGQIESVLSSGIGKEEKAKLQVAGKNVEILQTLISQLLDLSKLEAGGMKLHPLQMNIVSFIKVLFYSFESLTITKNISLLFESDRENIPVIFDPEKIEKVFYNLVSNAVKFTDPNGTVNVKILIPDHQYIEIQVHNDGPGISADHLPFIFDRFYQVNSPGGRKHEGTGIGLALAKELVELHHGSITVESIEESNTIFIVRLPAHGPEPVIEPEELPGGHREIILIVEDNKDMRDFIRQQLEGDFRIEEAENGITGILMAQEIVPDLIITDLMMPVMDGFKLCTGIRKDVRTSHIPVIMLTAKTGVENKIEGLETGIDDYITKPFSTIELKVRVRNLLNQRRMLRARFSNSTSLKPSEITSTSVDKLFLEKVIKTIEINFENRDFIIESLAAEVNMSVSQLNRKLNALIDQPAGQLMRSLRLERAADLLAKNAGTVAQVCYQLRFNDQAYFSRAFKKQFGCSPSEYMKS